MSIGNKKPKSAASKRSMWYLRRREYYARKKLFDTLGRFSKTSSFIGMIWALNRISEKEEVGYKWFSSRPPDIENHLRNNAAIYKWTLESLVNAFLRTKPQYRQAGRIFHELDTKHLGTAVAIIRLINALENAHDGLSLRQGSMIKEMPRIAQRQLYYQRGVMNKFNFFKSAYLYTFPEAAVFFEKKYGVSVDDFCFSGFALTSMLMDHPGVHSKLTTNDVPIDEDTLAKCIRMYGLSEKAWRQEAKTLQQVTTHAAYQSSVLRRWPCLFLENEALIMAPVPELIVERFTNGLFYDFADADGTLRDQIAKQFERLCKEIFQILLHELTVKDEFIYGPPGRTNATPDFFVISEKSTELIVECKGRKAPISVKFGDDVDPLMDSTFEELVKGAFQIWRFVSHIRHRLVEPPTGNLAGGVSGLVLLRDNWFDMSAARVQAVLDRAKAKCAKEKLSIEEVDQIPILFSNIEQIDDVLRSTTAYGFLKTIREASLPSRYGWHISSLIDEIGAERQDKDHLLDERFDEVIKWWRESPSQ